MKKSIDKENQTCYTNEVVAKKRQQSIKKVPSDMTNVVTWRK